MNEAEQRAAVVEAVAGARHLLRQIVASRTRLLPMLPLDAEKLRTLDDDAWDRLYAFQMKFLLLQDLASKRLLLGLLALSGEDPRDFSQREAVDRVAELGALTSGDDWLDLTLVRNALAHDYPVDLKQFIGRIDDAWTRCDQLVTNVELLIASLSKRGLV